MAAGLAGQYMFPPFPVTPFSAADWKQIPADVQVIAITDKHGRTERYERPKPTFTITLTEEETRTLRSALGKIGGHPYVTYRSDIDRISEKLHKAGAFYRHEDDVRFSGSLQAESRR